MGNGEAKELICTTQGQELRGGLLEGTRYWMEGDKGKKVGTTVIASSIKYI